MTTVAQVPEEIADVPIAAVPLYVHPEQEATVKAPALVTVALDEPRFSVVAVEFTEKASDPELEPFSVTDPPCTVFPLESSVQVDVQVEELIDQQILCVVRPERISTPVVGVRAEASS